MAHFPRVSSLSPDDRKECLRLLGCLLLGALLGAFPARLQASWLTGWDFCEKQSSWIPVFFRSAMFPSLMAVSFLLRRRWMFCGLFFLKGAVVAFTLGVFAAWRVELLPSVLPAVVIQSLLPLPVQFLVGSVWMRDGGRTETKLILLAPMILIAFLGALIQISLIS